MKVVLSRKGFDSGYGGHPSPVLPDGTMLSMPIPVLEEGISYSNLKYDGKSYYEYIHLLMGSRLKVEGEGIFDVQALKCHLDPDIRMDSYKRLPGWKGLFGQNGAAQSHLQNKGVGEGDLFLYFGWFRKTVVANGKLQYDPKCKGFHAIYGYLEVDKVEQINSTVFPEWGLYHPHVSRGFTAGDLDFVYTAKDELTICPRYKGYGVIKFSEACVLTKDGLSKSKWSLPDFMKNYSISYHSNKSWRESYFQSAAKGQEFVIECDDKITDWILKLFDDESECEKNRLCLFDVKPSQWGLRGDPLLWEAMKKEFANIDFADDLSVFISYFKSTFNKITKQDFDLCDDFYMKDFATGGMSSGMISMSFWREVALPLVVERFLDS